MPLKVIGMTYRKGTEMKVKTIGILMMGMGISLLLVALVGIYIIFFFPKIGPFETSERTFTVYASMISGVIIGMINTTLGIKIWKQYRNAEL
jgi:hypothetical protein